MRVAIILVIILSAAFADAADVLVSVRSVADDRGEIVVGICSADMFIGGTCAYCGTAPVRPGAVSVMVTGVMPGTYAVRACHDENGNHLIDRNLLGNPPGGRWLWKRPAHHACPAKLRRCLDHGGRGRGGDGIDAALLTVMGRRRGR
nr:DUF2141 domain-containing protein [Azospirillum sp. TSA2s]